MGASEIPRPLRARRSPPLKGTADIPGDKSISHRALILGGLAVGESTIAGLLEAEDVLRTAAAMRHFGADILRDAKGEWRVRGVGVGGLGEPREPLDFGNSGTGSRLVMGAMATTPITAVFTGDGSLRRRPMKRVLAPLARYGAEFWARDGEFMPITLRGADRAMAVECTIEVASAQVKSAALLAALNATGRSRISQRSLTRDHTERMLRAFGAQIDVEQAADMSETVSVLGEAELVPTSIVVPRDPSSAAFPLAAALIVPGSEITMHGILLNSRRTGLITTLTAMGAAISVSNNRVSGGEEIGDLTVRTSSLKGIEVPPERAPSMIDEYPILAVVAAFAEGRTVMRGLEELRMKESDRLAAVARGLEACGVQVEELADGLIVEGRGADGVKGGARIATHMDHRIAMSFLVGGLAAQQPITVDDTTMIATSFPEFELLMQGLGAPFAVPNA